MHVRFARRQKMTRAHGYSVVSLAAVLVALWTNPVNADRPTFTDVDFSATDPFLTDQCGFPVQVHIQGKLIDTQVGDRFMTRGAGYSVTFTNLSTGQSFLYQVSGLQQVSETIEGNIHTFTFSFSGGGFRLITPAQGEKVINAGKTVDITVVNFSTDPPTLVSFEHAEHGNFKEFLTEELICSLLSA
jgi:hypothetical protein